MGVNTFLFIYLPVRLSSGLEVTGLQDQNGGWEETPSAFERKIPGLMLGNWTKKSEEPGMGFEPEIVGSARVRIDWCLRGSLGWNLQAFMERIYGVSPRFLPPW